MFFSSSAFHLKHLAIAALLLPFWTLTILSSAQAAPDITGNWRTPDGAVVQVSKCGSAPCGKIVKFTPPPGKSMATTVDANNKDVSKRGRKILGLKILWRLKPDGNAWSGRIYDPRRGFSANATVRKKSSTQLEIRGCVRVVFNVCEKEIWRKAN